ncbi:hypothetical protein [Nocardia sp. NPDC058114]|uniref:hypothetical protein n=1 Tax=Nocardia sp. NPDC058114 TaxID=3346346 RepID=UPI0036DF4605
MAENTMVAVGCDLHQLKIECAATEVVDQYDFLVAELLAPRGLPRGNEGVGLEAREPETNRATAAECLPADRAGRRAVQRAG